jgi:hypothetical protein
VPVVLIRGKGDGLPRSKEKAIKFVIKVEVMEVWFVSLTKKVEEKRFTLKGNLAFKDFSIKEGEFGGPFFVGMPELIMAKEVERGRITWEGVARNGMVRGGGLVVVGGRREEGRIMNGVLERFIFMGSLIFIDLKGIIMERVITGAFAGSHGLLVFLGKDGSLII